MSRTALRRAAVVLALVLLWPTLPLVAQAGRALGTADTLPRLSPFQVAKAQALMRERLSCLGCHQLDGRGGQIGPDLSDVGRRRSPAYITAMIRDPQGTVPTTVMPRIPMPHGWRVLLAAYLSQRGGDAGATAPAPAPPDPGATREAPVHGAGLYAKYCAACHGPRGRGDGWNASHLPVRPTTLADPAYMSTRPDDTIYDGIAAGGYVLNRSHLMPPFGETLTREQIWALVRHIRQLCRCEGPVWSRDNR